MSRLLLAGFVSAMLLAAAVPPVQSQTPEQDRALIEALQKIKEENAALLERQTETLSRLDKMKETARQIKIFSRRS